MHGPSYEHDWLALYVYVHGSGLNNSFRWLGGSLMVAEKWFKTLKLPEKPEKRKLKISRIWMLHYIVLGGRDIQESDSLALPHSRRFASCLLQEQSPGLSCAVAGKMWRHIRL